MGALILPHRLQQQPQQALPVDWGNPLTRGLKLAIVPSIGYVNLATGARALQSTPLVRGVSTSGITHNGGSRAEFPGIDASKGLTLVSIWRAKAGGYLTADATRVLASNRTASNTGWSYGRDIAANGTSGGTLTRQSLTFQGVAQYSEANHTIDSAVDTPVVCRYNRSTNLISWFRSGAKSSPDTAAGTVSAGGNTVVGAQGDYAGNVNPWNDRFSVLLIFDQAKTDAEVRSLSDNPWQVFKTPARRLWATAGAPVVVQPPAPTPAPVGGGGGAGSVRNVRAFADELDKASKPSRAQKKRRKQAIETAVLELLPDEPVAVRVAPIIAQVIARELPATWAPVRAMQPITLPPDVMDAVRERVNLWLLQQMMAELEDEFDTELLLMG